jgi:hypothetical protein
MEVGGIEPTVRRNKITNKISIRVIISSINESSSLSVSELLQAAIAILPTLQPRSEEHLNHASSFLNVSVVNCPESSKRNEVFLFFRRSRYSSLFGLVRRTPRQQTSEKLD